MSAIEAQTENLSELAARLKPRKFYRRLDLWRKGGIVGGMSSDLVKSSRQHKLPQLDRMDKRLDEVEAEYRDKVAQAWEAREAGNESTARRLLHEALAIQDAWLFDITTAPKSMWRVVSDEPVCMKCGKTKEQFLKKNKKGLWRLKRGLCAACYQLWLRLGRPQWQYDKDGITAEERRRIAPDELEDLVP